MCARNCKLSMSWKAGRKGSGQLFSISALNEGRSFQSVISLHYTSFHKFILWKIVYNYKKVIGLRNSSFFCHKVCWHKVLLINEFYLLDLIVKRPLNQKKNRCKKKWRSNNKMYFESLNHIIASCKDKWRYILIGTVVEKNKWLDNVT